MVYTMTNVTSLSFVLGYYTINEETEIFQTFKAHCLFVIFLPCPLSSFHRLIYAKYWKMCLIAEVGYYGVTEGRNLLTSYLW